VTVTAQAQHAPILNPPDKQSHYLDVANIEWTKTHFEGIESKTLYSDPVSGMSTILFRMAPGAVVPPHEHVAVEQTWVFSGRLVDDEGEVGPGQYVWRPGGNRHMARAPDGAVFLSIFMKPNKYDSGARFFTEVTK